MAEHLGLTTVRQPLYESGVIGARLLLDRLDDGAAGPDLVEMPLEVVIRDTTSRRDD
jgi:DNA-binding LacI/PurR family transcriptional regulator